MVSCLKKVKKVDELKMIGSISVPQNVKAFYEGIPVAEGGVQAQSDAESDS